MKILLFKEGTFSWDGKETYEGDILWCHIESGDEKKVAKILRKIDLHRTPEKDVIIVPFNCLGPGVMMFDQAQDFFFDLVINISSRIVAPFGNANELHLNLPSSGKVKCIIV